MVKDDRMPFFCEHVKKGEVRSRKLRIVGFNTLKVILMTQTDVAL